jgi:hypothetical protein
MVNDRGECRLRIGWQTPVSPVADGYGVEGNSGCAVARRSPPGRSVVPARRSCPAVASVDAEVVEAVLVLDPQVVGELVEDRDPDLVGEVVGIGKVGLER